MAAHIHDLAERKQIARLLLASDNEAAGLALAPEGALAPETAAPRRKLTLPFPAGLAPKPRPIAPRPDPAAPLPTATVLVITWTADELKGLADVLTPGFGGAQWYPYRRRFTEDYAGNIRKGAPALRVHRLGSYFLTDIGQVSTLCFKSELHLNQDGIATGTGTATLPVKALLRQLIAEVRPQVVLTIGTSGGVAPDQDLGDVVVTRGAKFRLASEFRNESFNGQTFTSDWQLPTVQFPPAVQLMRQLADRLAEPGFGPPTKRYPFPGPLLAARPNRPDIKLDGVAMPAFHPVLTTDYFEYGTSANHLDQEGCAVEMGDAVLGLLCAELPAPPHWAAVRNLSDPAINADLPTSPLNMQTHWAVWYYVTYGYWTSVMGALATWAIIGGLSP
jgi:hypothetical protein